MPLYIFIPGSIGLIVFTVAFFKWPKYAIAGLIIAKPIIDVTWDNFLILDINFLKLYAGLFVILGLITIVKNRYSLVNSKLSIIWLVFLLLNFLSIFLISSAVITTKLKYFLAIANGFVIFTLCRYLFDWERDKMFFIKMFILAGVVPALIWLVPVIIGNPVLSSDPLQRIQGPYMNFWQFNFIGLQTLVFCLAYLAVSNTRLRNFSKNPFRILVFIMLIVPILMIYKSYSRAGWVTLFVVVLLWVLFMRKYVLALLIPVITAMVLFVPPFSRDSRKIYRGELEQGFKEGTVESRPLRGRLYYWKNALEYFRDQPFIRQLFGSGTVHLKIDNDYIRILVDNGMLGIMVYLGLLISALMFVTIQYFSTKNPVFLVSGITVIGLGLMSIGAHPSLIPNFQWFTWGAVGFAMAKTHNEKSL